MDQPFIEVGKGESPYVQSWMCESCGDYVGNYATNEYGQRFLLPLANCCGHCGTGPQDFELVSGKWQHVIEQRVSFFGHKIEERIRVEGFKRTGLVQQMSEFTEKFLECGTITA